MGLKYKVGDIITHKYDRARDRYMGFGIILQIDKDRVFIKFSKLSFKSSYNKASMYNFYIHTTIFRAE